MVVLAAAVVARDLHHSNVPGLLKVLEPRMERLVLLFVLAAAVGPLRLEKLVKRKFCS